MEYTNLLTKHKGLYIIVTTLNQKFPRIAESFNFPCNQNIISLEMVSLYIKGNLDKCLIAAYMQNTEYLLVDVDMLLCHGFKSYPGELFGSC